jgi:hypothetical protein
MRALAVLAAALLTACPGNEPGDVSQNDPAKTSTTTPPTELPGSRIAGGTPPTQDVQLTEYAIQIPDTLTPGRVRFKVANAGKENHNFAIEGEGVATKFSSDLPRGNSGEVSVELKPGTYTVYCPVDGHRGKGMERKVVVK